MHPRSPKIIFNNRFIINFINLLCNYKVGGGGNIMLLKSWGCLLNTLRALVHSLDTTLLLPKHTNVWYVFCNNCSTAKIFETQPSLKYPCLTLRNTELLDGHITFCNKKNAFTGNLLKQLLVYL